MAEPEPEPEPARSRKPITTVKITVDDESSLTAMITLLIQSSLPIMSHNANGVVDYNTLMNNRNRFMTVAERAYRLYARKRNELIPIYQWPPELLVRVASFLPYGTRETMCMHVCHRWRTALTAEPTLWTRVALRVARTEQVAARKIAAMQRFNARDKLSVQVACALARGAKYSLVAAAVGSAMSRLRELRIQCDDLARTAWLSVLSSPAPELEVLVIASTAAAGPLPLLPNNIFRGQAPKLHTVDLVHMGMPLAAGTVFSNVTRLSYTVKLSSVTEICRALEWCPKLEHLSIQSETADHSLPPANFHPKLKSFTIHKQVGSGYEDAIVVSNRRDSRLNIFAPLPNSRDATLSGVDDIHTVVASGHILGTACHLVAYGAHNYTRSALNVPVSDLVWALANGRDFLADVREMHIHDHLWAALENNAELPRFSRLEHLALLFQTASMAPFPRMFCLKASQRFDCPSLRTVTLSAYKLSRIGLPARNVASWLPEGVTRLALCNTHLEGDDVGVAIVQDYSHHLGWTVGDDVQSFGWLTVDGEVFVV